MNCWRERGQVAAVARIAVPLVPEKVKERRYKRRNSENVCVCDLIFLFALTFHMLALSPIHLDCLCEGSLNG